MQTEELRLAKRIQDKLSPSLVDPIARDTRFMVRAYRKISPIRLVTALCFAASNTSLRLMASTIAFFAQTTVSKQALCKRLNATTIDFLRHLLFATLAFLCKLPTRIASGAFRDFPRVLIQDSTSISLPSSMASRFPGPKNQTKKTNATLKIQTVYDALTQAFLSFELTPFTRNDQAASPDILRIARPHDLILRDLGYFTLAVLEQLHERRIYYLTRYRHGTALFHPNGKSPFKLLKQLRKSRHLDLPLCLGAKQRLPLRLVAYPVPKKVAKQRRKDALANRDKRLNPSKEHLALLGWQIFITNVPTHIWDTSTVGQVYALRWRIETIFKAWKSHFNIAHLPQNASPYQIEALIYARLLYIALSHTAFFVPLAQHPDHSGTRPISLLKFASFFKHNEWMFMAHDSQPLFLQELILYYCPYEKRQRTNYQQRILALS
jgi:hypothetical protein